MLWLTADVEYGYIALRKLAAAYGDKDKTKLSEIAPDGISEKFLLQVLSDLRRAGLVESHRGKHGGFCLTRAPDTITLADLLQASGVLSEPQEFDKVGPNSLLDQWWRAALAELGRSAEEHTFETAARELEPAALMYYI